MLRLNTSSNNFESQFKALLAMKREVSQDVDAAVHKIIADVRADGDQALADYSLKFDRCDIQKLGIRITANEITEAKSSCLPATIEALKLAKQRIEAYHIRQKPLDMQFTDELDVELGWRWSAVESVGLYVPGGSASYPSSVLMNAVPAKVAGVGRVVMVVPTPDGKINPVVLAAAELAGVDEIYRIGGAQAIAALAYGTKSIEPVVKIVGPGNAYVAAAKRQVFGQVGIDMIAGPSEVLVVADSTANADWIAADLLAQAEHDQNAQSILITDSEVLSQQVEAALESQLKTLPRADIARASLKDFGAVIIVQDMSQALPLINRIAPEHLELMTKDADDLAKHVRNAGAIFIGNHTPEAIGDYIGGSNHVLPTARSARFASGLGVYDYVKRTSLLKCSPDSLRSLGPAAIALGEAEGLHGHAKSVSIRLNL